MRLFRRSPRPDEATFVERWRTRVPGIAAQSAVLRPRERSVYVADGWGVTYASTRFRRLDPETGVETASARTFTGVRCFAPIDDDLLAATDTKLFRFDPGTLEVRQRWDERVPRYAASMAVERRVVVMANWIDPRLAIMDLDSGKVRRRDAPAMPTIHGTPAGPVVVGGRDGGTSRVDPVRADVRRILDTPHALDSAVAPDGDTLWLLDGVAGKVTDSSVSIGSPTRRLVSFALAGGGPITNVDLPEPAARIRVGRREIWAAGHRHLLVVPLPIGSRPITQWAIPAGFEPADWDPDVGLVLCLRPDDGSGATTGELVCYRRQTEPGDTA